MNYSYQIKMVVFRIYEERMVGYHTLAYGLGSTKALCISDFSNDLSAARRQSEEMRSCV